MTHSLSADYFTIIEHFKYKILLNFHEHYVRYREATDRYTDGQTGIIKNGHNVFRKNQVKSNQTLIKINVAYESSTLNYF